MTEDNIKFINVMTETIKCYSKHNNCDEKLIAKLIFQNFKGEDNGNKAESEDQ